MATFVQADDSGWSDGASVTLGSTPTEGNLLIAVVSERSGGSASNHTVTNGTWNHEIARTIEQGNSTYRRTHSVFWREAGASETSTFVADDGTSNSKRLSVYEYAHSGAEDDWSLLEAYSEDNGQTSNASFIDVGDTASVSGDNMFLFASGVNKLPSSIGAAVTSSWDNGFSENFQGTEAVNTMYHSGGSDLVDTVTGVKTSRWTLTGVTSNVGLSGAILIWDTTAPVGSGNTLGNLLLLGVS